MFSSTRRPSAHDGRQLDNFGAADATRRPASYGGRQLDNFAAGADAASFSGHANGQIRPKRVESLAGNPFLSSPDALRRSASPSVRGLSSGDHQNDPFISHAGKMGTPGDPSQAKPYVTLPAGGRRGFNIARQMSDNSPFLVYVGTVALWFSLRHYFPVIVEILTLCVAMLSSLSIVMGLRGYQSGGVPLTILGILSLIAVGLGISVGGLGWSQYMRQYWWMQTGPSYLDTFASSPAAAFTDAALLRFATETTEKDDIRGLPAVVDHLRSAGYRNSRMFCAAPILDASSTQALIVRVEYWAVGVDCCLSSAGHFHCDDSRKDIPGGGYGVVMLEDEQSPMIRAAIRKAEFAHNLVSAPGALLVRYVRDPAALQHQLFLHGMILLMVSSVCAFILLRVLDRLLWRQGLESWTVAQRKRHRLA